jgi:prenyltransferase beta subunit
MTLDEAETFCALARAKLLYDLEGMDVNTIMNFMITDDIWVNLYK